MAKLMAGSDFRVSIGKEKISRFIMLGRDVQASDKGRRGCNFEPSAANT
jgi:hypothetical protein